MAGKEKSVPLMKNGCCSAKTSKKTREETPKKGYKSDENTESTLCHEKITGFWRSPIGLFQRIGKI